jgi:V/A-type H+-transporting ATPase subunit A
VTRHTQRFTPCFWTLDKQLAEARVFPAVSIEQSYSASDEALAAWWHSHVSSDWRQLRLDALELLEEAARVDRTARLVGEESLPARQRLVLRFAALFEEAFLRQNAYDTIDASASPERQVTLLGLLMHCYQRARAAIDGGLAIETFQSLPIVAELTRAKSAFGDDHVDALRALAARIDEQVHA